MKHISQKDLQQMYAPMPEHFAGRMEELLARLPEGKEKVRVKKKMSVALVLTMVLMLLVAGAVAAAANWDAIRYLYAGDKPAVEKLMTTVNQKAEAGGVTLEVTSAITDGYALAMDWTLQAESAIGPVYVQMDRMQVNGETYAADSDTGLFARWIPQGQTLLQGGEAMLLPQRPKDGEVLHVELTLGVYQPKQEVTVFADMKHEDEAHALREQGAWVVTPVVEARSIFVDENGEHIPVCIWNREIYTEEDRQRFDRSEIKLNFDVQVKNTAQGIKPLYAKETRFAHEGINMEITEAVRTPLGVYATVAMSASNAGDDQLLGYYTQMRAPWNTLMYGRYRQHFGKMITDVNGRQHQVMTCGIVAYQDMVLDELQAVELQVSKWDDAQGRAVHVQKTNLYMDAGSEIKWVKTLKPLQENYDTPHFTARYKSIQKTAQGTLWFELLVYPKGVADETGLAAFIKQMELSITDVDGQPLKLGIEPSVVASWGKDADGTACIVVSGTVLFDLKQPESSILAVKCDIQGETYLMPFELYSEE